MLNRFRQIRNGVQFDSTVDDRLRSIVPTTPTKSLVISPAPNDTPTAPEQNRLLLPAEAYTATPKRQTAFHLIDPSDNATKSLAYSQYVQDFIYSTGSYSKPYSDPQLEMAFWTSVYLFAAIRRVSNLISKVRVVAEFKNGEMWQRLPETSRLNEILSKDMPTCLKLGYLNYAIYGSTLFYKTKTYRAMMAQAAGNPIYDYMDGAVGGLVVLDNPGWQLNETNSSAINSLKGVFLNYDYKDIVGPKNYLDRKEFVYITDWNPRDKNRGRSIASVAIHEAVTNAAIARWASEYFTRGTLPMLLVSMVDNPAVMTQADLAKQKRFFEEQYQGQAASLRSVFIDQKVDVNEIGITADRVAAPELNKNALEGISAAVGIERDLIIAPEGGTQGRHETMVQQAWNDTIIPLAEGFVGKCREDLGLPDNVRLSIDVSHIAELEADRGDRSTAELAVFEKSVQTVNETRIRLNQKPIPQLRNFLLVNGEMKSIEKIVKQDQLLDDKAFNQVTSAWDADLLLKSEALEMMNRRLPPGQKDGYKSQLGADQQSLGSDSGTSESDLPDSDQLPPNDGGPKPPEPKPPQPKEPKDQKQSAQQESQKSGDLADLLSDYDDVDENEIDIEPETVEIEDTSMFVSIPLSNNSTLIEMKRKLMRGFGTQEGIKWKTSDSLHVTLVFVEDADDETMKSVLSLVPPLFAPELKIGPLKCFKQEKKTIVAFEVCDTQELQNLRLSIVGAFQAYGVKLAQFSEIGNWNPHITICEIDNDIEIPNFNYKTRIVPTMVTFSRADESPSHFIKLKPNVYTIDVPSSRIETPEDFQKRRSILVSKILSWKETGSQSDLPESVVDCINEYIDRQDVFSAAIQACEAGMFDESASISFNPLEKFLKGIQKSASEELAAWKRVAKSNLPKAKSRFQTSKVPSHINEYVKDALSQATKSSSSEIDPIFAKAFGMLEEDGIVKQTDSDHLSALYDRLMASEDPDLKSLVEGL